MPVAYIIHRNNEYLPSNPTHCLLSLLMSIYLAILNKKHSLNICLTYVNRNGTPVPLLLLHNTERHNGTKFNLTETFQVVDNYFGESGLMYVKENEHNLISAVRYLFDDNSSLEEQTVFQYLWDVKSIKEERLLPFYTFFQTSLCLWNTENKVINLWDFNRIEMEDLSKLQIKPHEQNIGKTRLMVLKCDNLTTFMNLSDKINRV